MPRRSEQLVTLRTVRASLPLHWLSTMFAFENLEKVWGKYYEHMSHVDIWNPLVADVNVALAG